ncbi:MAG: L,D-transpeptidase [Verrucomicrobiae bacterium]|nr:L,D-transpeptidase [Verrucomicrobiae bacterium]
MGWLVGCASLDEADDSDDAPSREKSKPKPRPTTVAYISIAQQMMEVVKDGVRIARYPVSTSKYGLGDDPNSYKTPLGIFEIAKKIGEGVPRGGKFYKRKFTGVVFDLDHYDPILHPAEYDSILTRILWLNGLEWRNRRAYNRGIYIHGTNQEHLVGRPVSYGCIRMKNNDVLKLFNLLDEGAYVVIRQAPLPNGPSYQDLIALTQRANTSG